MKNAMSKKVIAMVLLATTFGTTTVSAAESVSKKETVYVNLDNSGSAEKTTVSDWIHSSKDDKLSVKDYSELSDIVNIKGDEKPTVDGNNLKWSVSSSDLYYQGTTNKDLPLDVNIKYYLNGKKISAKELAGKSGKVKIEISLKNNIYKDRDINGEKKRIYTIFSTGLEVMLPVDQFKSVKISSGKLVSEGNNNLVTFVAFPGLKDSLDLNDSDLKDLGLDFELSDKLTIEANVKKFSLQPIMVAATPEIPALDKLDEASSIDDLKKTINDKLDALNDNYKLLLDGSKQIADGVDSGVKQASSMLAGNELKTVQNLLTNDSNLNKTRKMMKDAASVKDMDISDVTSAMEKLNKGDNKEQLVKLTQDMQSMNSYSDLLNNTVNLLNDDKSKNNGKLTNAAIDTLINYDSLSEQGKQTLQALCSNLADYNKLSELQKLIKELKVTKAGYSNTSNVLNACISAQPGNSQDEKIKSFFNTLGTSLASADALTSDATKTALSGISDDVTNYANGYMLIDAQIAYAAAQANATGDMTKITDKITELKTAVGVIYGNSEDPATKQLAQSINAYIDGFDMPTIQNIGEKVQSDGAKLVQNQAILGQLTTGLNSLSTLNPLLHALNTDLSNESTKNSTMALIGSLSQDDAMLDSLENAIISFSDEDLHKFADILSSVNTINEQCKNNQNAIDNIKKNLSSDGKTPTISKEKVNDLLNKLGEFGGDVTKSQQLINDFSTILGNDFDVNKLNKMTDMGTKLVSMQNDLKDSSDLLRMADDALSDGNVKKANNLINSLPDIKSKISKLQDGSKKLYDGMQQYNDQGIKTIYDKGTSATKDFDKIMAYKDAVVEQAKDYDTFAGKADNMDGSVAFVMKTATIKAPEKAKAKETTEKKKGFVAWLKDLFGID